MELKIMNFIHGLILFLPYVICVDYYNYHFMEEMCDPNGTIIDLTKETSTYGNIEVVRDGGYSPNLDCKISILAPPNHRITFRFKKIEIYKPENDCTTDYVVVNGNTTYLRFCGTGRPGYSMSTIGRLLEITFKSGDWDFENERMGFWLYYTSYHTGVCDEDEEWECGNYRCIPRELLCDNYDNCGNWDDEEAGTCGLPTATIVMISVMTALCLGVCVAAGVYFVIDKKKGRHRRSRRRNNQSNNVVPAVGYNTGVVDPNAPPPYSSYFTTPAYSEEKDMPPAYSNLGFDTANTVAPATGTTTVTTDTNATEATTDDTYQTIDNLDTPSTSSRSSVVTPPTGGRISSQTSVPMPTPANTDGQNAN